VGAAEMGAVAAGSWISGFQSRPIHNIQHLHIMLTLVCKRLIYN
jgi:hypothetical protein